MSEKKQVEELGFIISENSPLSLMSSQDLAEVILQEGYHKQSEGERVVCGMFDDFFKCSLCGDMHPWQTAIEYNFCPHCGAKMKGEFGVK